MHKNQWHAKLADWRTELEASLDLSRATRIHLIAEEKGKGEIHRFLPIDKTRNNAELVVQRMITQLVERKLADQDPATMQIRSVMWVNSQTLSKRN